MTEKDQQSQMTMFQGLKRVFHYGKPYWKIIVLAILAMLLYSAGVVGRAYLIKPFMEDVVIPAEKIKASISLDSLNISNLKDSNVSEEVREKDRQKLEALMKGKTVRLLFIALGVVLMIPLSNFVRDYSSAYVVNRMLRDLQCDLCNKFLNMSLAYHNKAKKGEIYSRMSNDVARTSASFNLIFGELIQEPMILLMGIVAMFFLSWQFTLLLILLVPVLVLIIVRFGKKIRRKSLKRQETYGNQMGTMIQMFSGIKVVKAFRMEEVESERFRVINEDLFRKEMKVVKTGALSKSITDFFNNGIYLFFLVCGVYVIMKGLLGLTLADLVTFLALATTLYRPMKNLSRSYNQVSDAMGGIERVIEVLDMESEIQDKEGALEIDGIRDGICMKNVSFSYNDERDVLKDIDLEVKRGETVALVGKTGVGKTTMSDLIPRFYDPTRGQVLIDGEDLRDLKRDSLLSHIAVVTQDPFLFDTSIEENIRYGRPDASHKEIVEAARAAYIHEKIASLPGGYQTGVGDRGARLSGGERQRVTIARAILRNPSILILDEATSSLDAESEAWVKKAIDNLMKNRTTVVIAHRLSTIRSADKIVVLEDGKISMMGRHEELLKKEGLYRELCAMQFIEDNNNEDVPTRQA